MTHAQEQKKNGLADSENTGGPQASLPDPPQVEILSTDDRQKTKRASSSSLQCPICNEAMVNIHQLNRHIDDTHMELSEAPLSRESRESTGSKLATNEFVANDIRSWIKKKLPAETPALFSPLKRKTINLDLLDGNRGFGLSDSLEATKTTGLADHLPAEQLPANPASPRASGAKEITRAHWRQPSITGALECSQPGCNRTLTIKNGIVNCRKCGKLFCNEHTHCKVRLRNPLPGEGKLPVYDCTSEGVWCRSCKACYLQKPDLAVGVQVATNDITDQFLKKRSDAMDIKTLRRIKIQKRFIKNANLLAERFINESKASLWHSISLPIMNSKSDPILAEQIQIVGSDVWQDDRTSHCAICFTNFNFFIRKHHCRLCGRIVCNDPAGERQFCSILAPVTSLIERQPNLNYASVVKQSMPGMLDTPLESQDRISLRCCLDCKNDLLHSWKSSDELRQISDREIFTLYNSILSLKNTVSSLLPRYRIIVKEISHADAETDRLELNKARHRLMAVLKDFEGASTRFRTQFLQLQNGKLCIKNEYSGHKQLVLNMYQSTIMFLQDNLETFKSLNGTVEEMERKSVEKIEAGKRLERPRLTKREVREKREKLMVMKEQTFIVENLIESATKLRRFDEIELLMGNKDELAKEIGALEDELGDEGF